MPEMIVIKVGGHASKQLPPQFFQQLRAWHADGKHILIIHGGGPQINEWSGHMGIKIQQYNGIRVTDAATLEVTTAVLLGVVQPAICRQFSAHNLPVIGLNTYDNQLLIGKYLNRHNYGEVGTITAINKPWLRTILTAQIGILAPLVQTNDGHLLNVNADTAAAAIAAQLGANRLVLLTDVPGVLHGGKVMVSLDQNKADQLFKQQQITAGMMPKIKAAFNALHNGVHQVLITNDLRGSGTTLRQTQPSNVIVGGNQMDHIFPTYQQYPIDIVSGHDWYLTDRLGHTYLDFTSGIGVCNFGYTNQLIMASVEQQLQQIWHTSNLYESQLVDSAAQQLCEPGMLAFFCNSGTEANEAAFKLARKATARRTIITFNNSFHGRTYGSLSLTGSPAIKKGFGPLVPDVQFATYNDLNMLNDINEQTAAVILEIIQGEGGVINGEPDWLKQVETACHNNGALLIIDEVQTGIGRTGTKFAYQHFGLKPDIVTVAKGIGNGLPLGAMLGKQELAASFGPGTHGTTFGGNKLALAAAQGVLQQLTPAFLQTVNDKAHQAWQYLETEMAPLAIVDHLSGMGLMIGIHLNEQLAVTKVIEQLQTAKLLTLSAKHNTLRLLPPLVMSQDDLLAGLQTIKTHLVQLGG